MASLLAILRATSLALSGRGVVVEDILSQEAVQTIESCPVGNQVYCGEVQMSSEIAAETAGNPVQQTGSDCGACEK